MIRAQLARLQGLRRTAASEAQDAAGDSLGQPMTTIQRLQAALPSS